MDGGWGFVVRDHEGQVVGSGAGRLDNCADAMHAEAMAALQALVYASEAGMMRVELEVDSVNVQAALTTRSYDLSSVGMIIRDAKFLMFSEFNTVKVIFQPRSCNTVADSLARFGSELESGAVMLWPDENPSFVNSLMAADAQSVLS
ncbi:hypothetical protein QOZ80_7BG0611280 [Eleusine coracana subsp. coracana]|nr:hypothetical protein QOZ80_7BG0611280 [Eleusine coracana subsp. coracana]